MLDSLPVLRVVAFAPHHRLAIRSPAKHNSVGSTAISNQMHATQLPPS